MRKLLFWGWWLLLGPLAALGQGKFLLVGTYTARGSEGVYVYRFNAKTGALSLASIAKGFQNPSFLALSPDRQRVYVVEETPAGRVNALRFDEKTGQLAPLNAQPAQGDSPCHVAVDQTGRWVLVGNYSSGNLSVLPVLPGGALGPATQTIQHEGRGPNPQRQEKPHVHSVNLAANNRDVFVPDLGTDRLVAYTLDARTGTLAPARPPHVAVAPGAGPRHFAFHPNRPYAYAILELSSEVAAFRYENGQLTPLQTVSTLPQGQAVASNSCADIHVSPDGKFLYGSNRGHNSIVVYQIDRQTGKLTLVQHQPTLGDTPRNFALDPAGNFLLVANQNSDNIQVFRRDKKTGRLTPTGQSVKVSMPVCLKFG
jgi:6-phosphogluconolactonase